MDDVRAAAAMSGHVQCTIKIQSLHPLQQLQLLKFAIFRKIAPFATFPISQYPGFLLENQRLCGRACFIIPAEVKYIACYILQEETEVFITSRDYKHDIEK